MECGNLRVASECAAAGLRAGAIVFDDLTIAPSPGPLRSLVEAACEALRDRFPDVRALRESPGLAAFRQVYLALGINPRRDAPSCARLLEVAWKRRDLPTINTLVDVYNLVSIEHTLSIGAHDVETIALPVSMRLSSGEEMFVPLGAAASKRIRAGDFVYADARDRVICERDAIQAEFSKIMPHTSKALVIVEDTAGHEPAVFEKARVELIDLIARYCGGSARSSYRSPCSP